MLKPNGVYEDWMICDLEKVGILYDEKAKMIGNVNMGMHPIRVFTLDEWCERFKKEADAKSELSGTLPESWKGMLGVEIAEDICKMLNMPPIWMNFTGQEHRFNACLDMLKHVANMEQGHGQKKTPQGPAG
jgi:hypothetical protein